MRNKITYILFLSLFFFVIQNCKSTKSKFSFEKLLWTAEWSPDDKYIAVGGNTNELKILSSDYLNVIKSIKKSNTITKIKWHPIENLLAITRQGNDESGSTSDKSQIINIKNNSVIDLEVHGARGLGWNYNGKLLAVGGLDGALSIYSKEGILIKKFRTDQKAITGLSWHPTKNIVATVGSHIEIIDVPSEGKAKVIPRDIEILMLCVEWHPSGSFFVTGDYGDSNQGYKPLLQYWGILGKKIKEISGSKAEYRNLRWTKKGDYFVTASDKIRLWTKDGQLIKEQLVGGNLWGIDWNKDESKLVVTREDGLIILLNRDLKTLKKQ